MEDIDLPCRHNTVRQDLGINREDSNPNVKCVNCRERDTTTFVLRNTAVIRVTIAHRELMLAEVRNSCLFWMDCSIYDARIETDAILSQVACPPRTLRYLRTKFKGFYSSRRIQE